MRVEATPGLNFGYPGGSQVGPLRPLKMALRERRPPTSLEKLGFDLVRFGRTKCFRVFQPRALSGEEGFEAGDSLLVRKIKTEGSNRN